LASERLKVLTLNIWHRERDWEARRSLIRREIEALQPDVVGLQEVLRLSTQAGPRSQAHELSEGLGYAVEYGCAQRLGSHLELGNALLSRHPMHDPEVRTLPGEETGETRSVLYTRVATPQVEVPVFVTHLNWKLHHGAVRRRQVQALVDFMDERAPIGTTYPPILMGDLNAEPESDEIRWLKGLATIEGRSVFLADAWSYGGDGGPGFTFDRKNPNAARSHEPPRRIDYVFVRGPDKAFRGEPLATRVVFDAPEGEVWASDHFGVYTELSV
jgi:endonuclease/exonuclease/phosphatase family metal-dependent hydrolase